MRAVASLRDHDLSRSRDPPDECIADMLKQLHLMIAMEDQGRHTNPIDLVQSSRRHAPGWRTRIEQVAALIARPLLLEEFLEVLTIGRHPRQWVQPDQFPEGVEPVRLREFAKNREGIHHVPEAHRRRLSIQHERTQAIGERHREVQRGIRSRGEPQHSR